MSQSNKNRLDQILLDRGLFPSRETARTAIIDGGVIVNGEKITKAGYAVRIDAQIEVLERFKKAPYVSRGGLKLARALEYFKVPVQDKVAIDVGASTGGFTDCLLQNGAAFVYAVDVGYGQIDWSLRTNDKVRVIERTNIRNLTSAALLSEPQDQPPSLAVMDCSFISVIKTVPPTIALMTPDLEMVILIKPQFEAGRGKVGKGGVVREPALHLELLQETIAALLQIEPLKLKGLTYSPIKGPSGNIEYLLYLTSKSTEAIDLEETIKASVAEAFSELNKAKEEV
ncbi:MAG: TlyA family RNA methyltransferase [Candidatus Obscuribacter sp.]|jgi:23S rRNA (cytidine1920-2'-O)/16S rRNA (cytidine1409-2'-O)-methyltransferase|nr:TlyA family RNA methyltransferase [Candidatus Obscuribacter sp.]MBK7837021.1 TlyA family RNA methyltransferase [Candidatus Obscuribacter sp.]MBK9203741.1 TlyA family RNA methyltransferase [Candidatus Obscuribacter sp.]MBK9773409.1 TlyA family RNA methyltransferase [Candidatus Obscuribacter sp.]MBL0187729.1 TlyA family RNA methyltransferase [Candidatus Obscuribacter sp.]